MTSDEYLAEIHLALVEGRIVASYTVVRQRVTSQSGHLRVRIELINGDFLEASEFFRLTSEGIKVIDYRHQWINGERTVLHKRWDSAPHQTNLKNAPYHRHEGSNGRVVPDRPRSIQEILVIIAEECD